MKNYIFLLLILSSCKKDTNSSDGNSLNNTSSTNVQCRFENCCPGTGSSNWVFDGCGNWTQQENVAWGSTAPYSVIKEASSCAKCDSIRNTLPD